MKRQKNLLGTSDNGHYGTHGLALFTAIRPWWCGEKGAVKKIAHFPSTSYGEGNPRFFLPVCVEKNWCNGFSRTGSLTEQGGRPTVVQGLPLAIFTRGNCRQNRCVPWPQLAQRRALTFPIRDFSK